ncbi:MAG: carboxypeptidase regulatory-like domain-containing protein [Bacteroidales bacterium]|nr:carboxypeptidase regulatory-like domain-containing protein [Bacteroidales bacterium]
MFSPVGTYTTNLMITSNDLAHPSVSIPCTMNVIIPGYINGIVTDCVSGQPIAGVMVTAGPFTAMTDGDGNYSIMAAAGTYAPVVISQIGYTTVNVASVTGVVGATTTLMPSFAKCLTSPLVLLQQLTLTIPRLPLHGVYLPDHTNSFGMMVVQITLQHGNSQETLTQLSLLPRVILQQL